MWFKERDISKVIDRKKEIDWDSERKRDWRNREWVREKNERAVWEREWDCNSRWKMWVSWKKIPGSFSQILEGRQATVATVAAAAVRGRSKAGSMTNKPVRCSCFNQEAQFVWKNFSSFRFPSLLPPTFISAADATKFIFQDNVLEFWEVEVGNF